MSSHGLKVRGGLDLELRAVYHICRIEIPLSFLATILFSYFLTGKDV